MKNNRSFKVTEIKFNQDDFTVDVTKYAADQPADKTIIVFAPTGGTNFIDRSYAKLFAKSGFDVFLLKGWTGDHEVNYDLELHQRFYSRAEKALSLSLANINSPFVGLLGTSVGALHAAVGAAKHPRLEAVFAIVGGLDLAEVIVTSDQKAMLDLKAERKKRYGFKTDEEIKLAIQKAFHLEPRQLGVGHQKKDLGLVIALNDTTIPTKTQMQLKDFWQPTTVIEYDNGHFWTIVKSWLFSDKAILEFFENSYAKKSKPIK
ncbi:MAG: hypothetical protein H7061_01055 [Bdellovibrionaceae bacterium]|nr:hypothetical protein [Bdellovibrio sp.]